MASAGLLKVWHGAPMWAWTLAGVVGIGGSVYLYKQRKAATAAATAPPLATAATAAGQTSAAGTAAPGTAYGQAVSQLAQQQDQNQSNLLSQLLALQPGTAATSTPAATTYTPPAGETLSGSGYYVPGSTAPITGSDGSTYSWISNYQQWLGLKAQGATGYYQPVPGVFMPITDEGALLGGNSPQGPTPYFLKLTQGAATAPATPVTAPTAAAA